MKSQMKTKILLVLAILGFALAMRAQYSINWWTIDGGGGTSTGGVYTVTGTIGQPDAGALTGGNFSLVGGFWSHVAAVPTPGAPLLTIFRTTTNTVVVSWPSPSTGFALQQTLSLSPTNWTAAPAPADNGTVKYITINPPVGSTYFRLVK
jgi:hypothetical protein